MKKLFTFFSAFLMMVIISMSANAQKNSTPATVVPMAGHDTSMDLKNIAPHPGSTKAYNHEKVQEWGENIYGKEYGQPPANDPVIQYVKGTNESKGAAINFAGVINSDNGSGRVVPPDTDGDIGPNHYFQCTNNIFEIFDREGNSLYGPAGNSTIWDGFSGDWTGLSITDPIVLYDEQADKWFFSVFTSETGPSTGDYFILIAVSQTGDPTGSYYRYAYGSSTKPDYPKYGVWPNGYFMGCNNHTGPDIWAFNRDAFLLGNGSSALIIDNPDRPNTASSFHAVLPADCDGPFPASSTPAYYITINDDAWVSNTTDRLMIWEFDVDWSPYGGSWTLAQSINTASFDTYFTGGFHENITQPGTTQKLDALSQVLMYRAQYRYIGGQGRLVCNHSVDVGTDHAGIRWYELRKSGTNPWTKYQESTYAPDADNRWMGSIAMNANGDIAIEYSVSGTSTYPSIMFTGRKAGDALNTMTFAENSIWAGTLSQYGDSYAYRWGDYSSLRVDPVDDMTFWATNEYVGDYGGWNPWATRIAAFSLGGYCAAGATNTSYEYIANVSIGSIYNSTGSDGYTDYTNLSTDIPMNSTDNIAITNGVTSYSSDQCGIWVDWNRDGDFDDANETVSVTGTPGVGPYTATIDPPSGVTLGECTMRVRITYTGTVEPCGTTSYGEVEDYTINLTPNAPNEWIGVYNYWWHNANNWSLGHIPTADEDVIITSAGYQPPKCDGAYIEECNDLTINSGGTLNMVDGQLTTNGDVNISGTLGMIHDNAEIICNGDFAWNSGSSANITNPAFIRVYGDWNFNSGANANFANGFVDFVGTSSNWVRAYSNNCSFYNIWVHKTGGAVVRVSYLSSQDLVVNNLTFIYSGSSYVSFSSHNLVMKGPFNYYGTFDFTQFSNTGAVVFDGTTQQINNYSSGSGVFNNVIFSSSGTTTLQNAGIDVMGDLTIESGSFNSNGLGVELHGSWDNTGGTYAANGSTVTFNGNGISSPQDVYGTSTFYDIVQLNTGTYLRFQDANSISNNLELHGQCWAYNALSIDGTLNIDDVTSRFGVYGTAANATVASLDQGGEIAVSQGVLTVDDLVESGIEGTYNLISGEINLTQASGLPDLNANLTIDDGQFILNATSSSWWAYGGDASLNMSGGTLDFNTSGCNIYASSNTLTLNITGGTIRSAGYFTVSNPVFTPTAGLVELYSTSDASFSTVVGTNVYDVLINKSAKSGTKKLKLSERDIAAGIKPGGGSPKANMVNLTSDVDINGDFTIDAGVFNTSTYNMNVAGDWTNNVGDGGFLENTNLVTFDGNTDADITTDETFYNMGVNKVSGLWYALELMGITLNVTNNLDINSDAIEMNAGSTLDIGNDIYIASGAGLNAFGDTGLSIFVGGNWINDNTYWNTNIGYSPGTETLTFDGGVDQTLTTNADREEFGNLVIDMSGGEFRSNDSISVLHDFTLTQGLWHDNQNGLTHYFQGDFYITSGVGAIWSSLTGNTVVFKGTGDQTVHNPFGAGYFYKVIVDKTDFAKKKNSNTEGSEIAEVGESSKKMAGDGTKAPMASMVSLTSDLDIENGTSPGLTINEGTLNLNGNTFWTMGDININDGGKLIVDDGALLRVDDGGTLNVYSGGILETIGSSGNNARISNRNTGFYAFSVKPGGTISANEATFEDMWANGLYVEEGATIDPANAFTNCTFQNGSPGYAGLLGLNSSQTLTLTGLNFPTNTNGTDFNIWKLTDVGDFTIEGATGEFMGPEFELDDYDRIHWGDIDIELDLTLMLAGPYNGTNMNTDLNNLGLIPLNQPFNSNTAADWYYTGGESVGAIPANVVDWVLVEIKDATDAASSASAPVVAEQAAFLLNDGSIVDLDGSSNLIFTGLSYTSGLFPVIWHRNHLGIISSDKLVRTGGIYPYDFRQAGSAYSNTNLGEINLGGGVWGMFGGDSNGSGWVYDGDTYFDWNPYAGETGYRKADYNLDGQLDNNDKNDVWFDSYDMHSQIPGSKGNYNKDNK